MQDQVSASAPTLQAVNAHAPTSLLPTTPASGSRRIAKPRTKPLRKSSLEAYAKDVRLFKEGGGTIPCDAAALLRHILSKRLKMSPHSLYRRAMAVRHAHLSMGLPSPTEDAAIRPTLRALQLGIVPDRRALQTGASPNVATAKRHAPKPAAPVTRRMLAQVCDALGRNMLDRRDRALLLLSFMGALKRSTLLALNVTDLRFTADALIVTIRESEQLHSSPAVVGSGEPMSRTRQLAVPATSGELCAAKAVREWIQTAGMDIDKYEGPLFPRFDRGGAPTSSRLDAAYLNIVLKKRLKAVGIDPARFAAQSLRSGRVAELGKGVL